LIAFTQNNLKFLPKTAIKRGQANLITSVVEKNLKELFEKLTANRKEEKNENLVVQHEKYLNTIESYIQNEEGPYLLGSTTFADAILFPYFVFYENYFPALKKRLFAGRARLKEWWMNICKKSSFNSIKKDILASKCWRIEEIDL